MWATKSTRENGSFGLTTLRNRHVRVTGATVRFLFRGKSGREHQLGITDRRVASVIKHCEELPGQMLFQYIEENGERGLVTSDDVNGICVKPQVTISAKDPVLGRVRSWQGVHFVIWRDSVRTEAKRTSGRD